MIYMYLFMFIIVEVLMYLYNIFLDDMYIFYDEYVLFMVCENNLDNII